MRVRNRTGIKQTYSLSHVTLEPGVWTENVPRTLALKLHRQGVVDLWEGDVYKGVEAPWKSPSAYQLLWMSPFSLADGYATASESTVLSLQGRGFELFLLPCWFASRRGLQPPIKQMLDRGLPTETFPRVGLCMATPGEFRKLMTDYRIGLTMYEADNPLQIHPEWRRDCAEVDRLFVPSNYCKEIFSHFVERAIDVVPLGINSMFYADRPKTPKPDGTFTFFMHGTLTSRKAPIEMMECFKRTFPADKYPRVRILFKTRLGIFGRGQDQIPSTGDSRITIIGQGDWSADKLRDTFRTVDAYVFPSKGEGYGMTPREAMVAGLPVILSDNTALSDVCDARYNWPVPTKSEEPSVLGGVWRIPDWDIVSDYMRSMVEDPGGTLQKAWQGALWCQSEHSPEIISQRWLNTVSGIDPAVKGRDAEPQLGIERLTERSLGDLTQEHAPFLDWIRESLPPGTSVLDLGVGTGLLSTALRRAGYRVTGCLGFPEEATATEERVKSFATGVEFKRFNLYDAATLNRVCEPAAIVCQGVLQQLSYTEIDLLIKRAIEIYKVPVYISVPTLHYAGIYRKGAILKATDTWRYYLSAFAVDRWSRYGPAKAHLMMRVVGLDDHKRGSLIKRVGGNITDGVWRPTQPNREV